MVKIENDVDVKKYLNSSIRPVFRVTIRKNEKFFGPGIARLIHLTEELGSISAASNEMGISYSKAWTIIKRMEKELNMKVFETKTGGKEGGASMITPEAKSFLDRYDKMMDFLDKQTAKAYQKYFLDGK